MLFIEGEREQINAKGFELLLVQLYFYFVA